MVDTKSLQLCLYYDGLEIVNPLGSRRGIHKLGVFYFTLKNLPPQYNSRLDSIHLVAVLNCLDLQRYGFSSILAPFMKELKLLESDQGVRLEMETEFLLKRVTLIRVSGDSLCQHAICGFVENFSASKPCRLCHCSKEDIQEIFTERGLQLRTVANYREQLERVLQDAGSASFSGIKMPSVLNESRFFHVTSIFSADIMHDILEGVAPMEVKYLLNHMIFQEQLFGLDVFYMRLSNYDYGFVDRGNKPFEITLAILKSSDHGLKQKASQMWCLTRVSPGRALRAEIEVNNTHLAAIEASSIDNFHVLFTQVPSLSMHDEVYLTQALTASGICYRKSMFIVLDVENASQDPVFVQIESCKMNPKRICVTYGDKSKLVSVNPTSIKDALDAIRKKLSIHGEIKVLAKCDGISKYADVDPDDEDNVYVFQQISHHYCNDSIVKAKEPLLFSCPLLALAAKFGGHSPFILLWQFGEETSRLLLTQREKIAPSIIKIAKTTSTAAICELTSETEEDTVSQLW
ncbi:hypothetical protein HOLleu_10481 [Holothuria leucospilota]|uniref:Uncharacterized protein n=1 Tax=Holothuria leucospilota TaxID=206669 RepID=A0A9Q1CDP8_HOLLE|nr:hypothetical protein HOLleu_10481 [Holothuria leucospilota]